MDKQVVVRVGRVISSTGLFAYLPIRGHALIAEFKGELISRTEMELHEQVYFDEGWVDEYLLESRDCGVVIDVTVFGNRSRFANHSSEPNAEFYTVCLPQSTLLVFVYAVTDIDAAAQITVGYNWPDEDATLPMLFNCRKPSYRLFIGLS